MAKFVVPANARNSTRPWLKSFRKFTIPRPQADAALIFALGFGLLCIVFTR